MQEKVRENKIRPLLNSTEAFHLSLGHATSTPPPAWQDKSAWNKSIPDSFSAYGYSLDYKRSHGFFYALYGSNNCFIFLLYA